MYIRASCTLTAHSSMIIRSLTTALTPLQWACYLALVFCVFALEPPRLTAALFRGTVYIQSTYTTVQIALSPPHPPFFGSPLQQLFVGVSSINRPELRLHCN